MGAAESSVTDDESPLFMQQAIGKIQNNVPFRPLVISNGTFEVTQGAATGKETETGQQSCSGLNFQRYKPGQSVPTIDIGKTMLTKDSVVNSVISQFAERSRIGLEKYGTTLDRTDLSLLDWVQHAQEEMMDGILYLEKIKRMIIESKTATETMEEKEMER
jgi:hypothetical protein